MQVFETTGLLGSKNTTPWEQDVFPCSGEWMSAQMGLLEGASPLHWTTTRVYPKVSGLSR